jgi:anti-anti-sigma factor
MRTDFRYSACPPWARLQVVGDLDLSTDHRLCDVVDLLLLTGCTEVELDLEGVTFIDAHALHVLDQERARLVAAGGEVSVVAASASLLFVAGLAGYDSLLPELDAPPRLVLLRQAGADDP